MHQDAIIQKAVSVLKKGGLIAIPTETVYGLAGDAINPIALQHIFRVKNRPPEHPLIVHIADVAHLNQWAIEISSEAYQLANAFWPGPLTLILKKAPQVSSLITGGQNTIGIRIPNHPMALAILKEFGGGVAAPSANRYGRISPTSAIAVKEELGNEVDFIVDGGVSQVGIESTIVDVSSTHVRILRPGIITATQIEAVLKNPLENISKTFPRVSGSDVSHYAPITPARLVEAKAISTYLKTIQHSATVLYRSTEWTKVFSDHISYIHMPNNAYDYAHCLYQTLRDADKKHFSEIIIESVPNTEEWLAVNDRLKRATQRSL